MAEGCEETVRLNARKHCLGAAWSIVELTAELHTSMPAGMQTSLNGHIHSLLYAASVFLFELLLDDRDSGDAEWRARSETCLHRVMAMLEGMSSYRPAARQALRSLQNSYRQLEQDAASRRRVTNDAFRSTASGTSHDSHQTSSTIVGADYLEPGQAPLPIAQEEGGSSDETFFNWPADGLDAFLFSGGQFEGDLSAPTGSGFGDTWLATATLLQSQGHWSSFLR